MSMEDKFIVEVKRNLWLLSFLGYVRRDDETIAELQQRVKENLPEDLNLQYMTFYEEQRYGSWTITEEMLEITKEEHKQLLMWLKQTRHWYYYYILLRLCVVKVNR